MARTRTPDRRNPDGSTTVTMQRACNGCGHLIGDVTDAEVQAVIEGRPLPDARNECPNCTPTGDDESDTVAPWPRRPAA